MTDRGLELIDGQHTAIAAASHPGISEIPVMIVEAEQVQDRATAFIGHNRDRLNVTQLQLFHASVTAGDADAVKVHQFCTAAGIEIPRTQPKTFKPRQSIAVTALTSLIVKRPEKVAVRVLVALVNANFAPIRAEHVRAIELLFTSTEYAASVDDKRIVPAIVAMGADAEREARAFAATHRMPYWRALGAVWFRNRNKRFSDAVAAPRPAAPAPAQQSAAAGVPLPAAAPSGPKKDMRPALSGRGWQPGVHVRRCRTCEQTFQGHPQAIACADCAYAEPEEIG